MRGDFDEDEYDDDFDCDSDSDFDDDEFFDCHMDRNGQCGKAGSEECDFECPIMADIRRAELRRKQRSAPSARGERGRE